MRVTALLALGCYAAIARAEVAEDVADAAAEASSSVGSIIESVTSSAVDKPTFTVSAINCLPWLICTNY
jgi:calnexin